MIHIILLIVKYLHLVVRLSLSGHLRVLDLWQAARHVTEGVLDTGHTEITRHWRVDRDISYTLYYLIILYV